MTAVLLIGEVRVLEPAILGRLRSQLEGSTTHAAAYNDIASTTLAAVHDLCGAPERVLLLQRRDVETACTIGNRTQRSLLQWYQFTALLRQISLPQLRKHRLLVKCRPDLFFHDLSFHFATLAAPIGNGSGIAALSDLVFYGEPNAFLSAYQDFYDVAMAKYALSPYNHTGTRCLMLHDGSTAWAHDGCRLGMHSQCLGWVTGPAQTSAKHRAALLKINGVFMSEFSMSYHLRSKRIACLAAHALGPVSMLRGAPPNPWLNSSGLACQGKGCLGPKGMPTFVPK